MSVAIKSIKGIQCLKSRSPGTGLWVEIVKRQTPVKTLPSRKILLLRTVKIALSVCPLLTNFLLILQFDLTPTADYVSRAKWQNQLLQFEQQYLDIRRAEHLLESSMKIKDLTGKIPSLAGFECLELNLQVHL